MRTIVPTTSQTGPDECRPSTRPVVGKSWSPGRRRPRKAGARLGTKERPAKSRPRHLMGHYQLKSYRTAVTVVDPRGNEVMAIRTLS